METAVYHAESALEAHHWWFVGRRRLFAALLRRRGIAATARVLDIGTSSGTNLRLMRELGFARAVGVDASIEAARLCRAKGFAPVSLADACALPFADASFDLVLLTDVIEHIGEDVAALREARRVLRPGGDLLITVPAFPALWGCQDEVSHHRRRYRRAGLRAAIAAAQLELADCFHFNFLLFPAIFAARRLIRRLGLGCDNENTLTGRRANALLARLFAVDVALAPVLRPPFGVSLLAWARKPEARQREQSAAPWR